MDTALVAVRGITLCPSGGCQSSSAFGSKVRVFTTRPLTSSTIACLPLGIDYPLPLNRIVGCFIRCDVLGIAHKDHALAHPLHLVEEQRKNFLRREGGC